MALSRLPLLRRPTEGRLAWGTARTTDPRAAAGDRARGPGAIGGAERQSHRSALRGRATADPGGAHPGSIRAARDATHRGGAGACAAAPAGTELSTAASDRRPGELLGEHLSTGAKGTEGPLPEARLARRPARRRPRTPATPGTLNLLEMHVQPGYSGEEGLQVVGVSDPRARL